MRLAFYFIILTFVGCGLMKDRPNNAAAFTSDQIVNLAIQVEHAQVTGILDEESGDEYLTLLIKANELLGDAVTTFGEIAECVDAQTKHQCIGNILQKVEGAL